MTQQNKLLKYSFLLGITLFSLLNSFYVSAQKIERFSNKEGFNQNTINAIEKDKYGMLWFGTPNGLIKFDGYEFKSYNESDLNSISNNYVSSLFNDSNNTLWIGSNTGLDIYIPWLDTFKKIPIPSQFRISNISSGPNGNIWVSSENEIYILTAIDIEKGTYNISENILNKNPDTSYINDFSFLEDSSTILATSKGLVKLTFENNEYKKLTNLTNFSFLSDSKITVIKKIKDIFWVGTDSGLYKTSLEGDNIHVIKKYDHNDIDSLSHSNLFINTILQDHNESIWIGTKEHGLAKYVSSNDTFQSFTYDPKNKSGLSSPYIYSIFEDDFNVIWIGTAQGGINKLDLSQKQFINYTNNPYDNTSIPDNLITSILEDSTGKLWVSSYNQSLFRSIDLINDKNIQNLRFEHIDNFPLPKQDIVRCIYEDKKGYIWIGSEFSLIVYNPKNKSFKKLALKQYDAIVPDQIYFTINQTDNNKILLGGNQIIVLENPWQQIDSEKEPIIEVKSSVELGSKIAHTILKDSRDSYWIGTVDGLLKGVINDGEINVTESYEANNYEKLVLSNSNIFSLHEDKKGYIWVGTFGGGLNKLSFDNSGKITNIDFYRKKNVLPDDAVYGILPEGDEYLWISTDMGLCKFNMKTNDVDVFDVRDGLNNNNFRQSAYFKGTSGYYYFGGLNGLTIFKPSTIKFNEIPPNVFITELHLENELIQIGDAYKGDVILNKSISETESISISQNEEIISFSLVSNHSTSPFKNKLAYKLEGFNDDWVVKDDGKINVTYTNLSPGSYLFKVKGTNGDGLWSEETKGLKVEILPPWYSTWWSILIFILLILLITTGLFIYFVQHEKLKQKLKYEELDKKRLDLTNEGKFRFFTNISHEFRTPLTLISGPLERIIEQNTDSKNIKYLEIIHKNTQRLLSLVDQLITFRQAEQGHTILKLSKNTLGNFMYPATEGFENYALEKNINFFYRVNSPEEEIIIDVKKIERIIFNLLSNSFKNTPANGNISIESDIIFSDKGKLIRFDVIDDGKGIPEKNLDNIFERFYQLGESEENKSGGGIGLAFCKSLIEILGGSITAKSKPYKETRFSVIIPSKTEEEYNMHEVAASGKSFIKDWFKSPINHESIQFNNSANDIQKEHTILIVENEEGVQNFLMTALSESYNIIIANNGVEGIEKMKLNKPNLIISDVMMPEMDGFEFCEKIKADVNSCDTPIILLTALGDNENLIKGLEFGADEYISKPFSLKHLELRVHRLIKNNIRLKAYFSKNSLLPKKDIDISSRDVEFLNKVINVIEKNMSNSNFGVEELAKEINLSNSHFYRRLKQLTGQVPNVYIRNFRLQKAAELLRKNDGARVIEVMHKIGIESTSYFSTSFKKLHGVSPSEYK